MAKLTAGGATYEFDEGDVTNRELIAIERATGLTNDELWSSIRRGSLLGMTALVWMLRRREEPDLAFDDVVFPVASFDIDDSDDVGKDSPDAGGRSSKTSSTTTSSRSRGGSASTRGTSSDSSDATT